MLYVAPPASAVHPERERPAGLGDPIESGLGHGEQDPSAVSTSSKITRVRGSLV